MNERTVNTVNTVVTFSEVKILFPKQRIVILGIYPPNNKNLRNTSVAEIFV